VLRPVFTSRKVGVAPEENVNCFDFVGVWHLL